MAFLSDSSSFNWSETKRELTKALSHRHGYLSHGRDDFIDLCLSRIPCSSFGSTRNLVVFISLGFALIATFTIKFACPGRRVNATPSWTVLYVGIAVAALTYPLVALSRLPMQP